MSRFRVEGFGLRGFPSIAHNRERERATTHTHTHTHTLTHTHTQDAHKGTMVNLFRIPLNLIVISTFLSMQHLGVAGALSLASACLVSFCLSVSVFVFLCVCVCVFACLRVCVSGRRRAPLSCAWCVSMCPCVYLSVSVSPRVCVCGRARRPLPCVGVPYLDPAYHLNPET